jgi:MCP family monocarboxylic acid transporter-like MFS transporter 10
MSTSELDRRYYSDLTDREKNAPDKVENESTSHEQVRPDGGCRAWACVAGSFLLQFCSFGYVNAYAVCHHHRP